MQIAALGARELHSRSRTNNYLTKSNKDLFHPVNLHAMIMAFDPDVSGQKVVDVDTSSGMSAPAISTQANDTTMSALASSRHASGLGAKFKLSEGSTRSEAELVQAASLIFPTTDRAMMGKPNGSSNHDGKVKRASKFLADYLDCRAQAEYVAKHGTGSALAIPGAMDSTGLAGRFSNPNDPASTGNLRALLPINGGSSPQGGAYSSDPSSNVSAAPGNYGSSPHFREEKHEYGGNHSPNRRNGMTYDSRESSADRSAAPH